MPVKQLRQLRLERGWSQEHLAELVGVSTRTIQRIEKGFKPCLETSTALAAVFEVDLARFTSEPANPATTPADIAAAQQADEEAVARLYVQGVKEFYNHLLTYLCVAIVYGYLSFFHGMGDKAIIVFGLAIWGIGVLTHGLIAFEKINVMGLGAHWEKQAITKKLECNC